jgi:ssDNA-binding Zn-finger/Zn-ribbon topoisomerase 1
MKEATLHFKNEVEKMNISEFEKIPFEKKDQKLVENEFKPCPKCGGKVTIKKWKIVHHVWADGYPDPEDETEISDWSECGDQFYVCKNCGYTTETEQMDAVGIISDEYLDIEEKK